MTRMGIIGACGALIGVGVAASCVSPDLPLEKTTSGGSSTSSGGGSTGSSSAPSTSGTTSSSTTTTSSSSGGGAGGAGGGPTYNDVTSAPLWETFDLAAGLGNPEAKGKRGAGFDGRYVYFAPSDSLPLDGLVVRYDTHGPGFVNPGAWATYDIAANVSPLLKGFVGAGFDGRYLYFVPFSNVYGSYDGVLARYDTTQPFTSAASWESFDISAAFPGAKGFAGAVFDGQYLYLAPNAGNTLCVRYDTKMPMNVVGAYAKFDTTPLPGSHVFHGALFDGRFVYMAPQLDGNVPRYDTQKAFGDPASWQTFNVSSVDNTAQGFSGMGFDGRYVYMAPLYSGAVARYDTQAPFGQIPSWETVGTTMVNGSAQGFRGTVFDGRRIYFVPYGGDKAGDGHLMTYDTQQGFQNVTSWTAFDLVANVSPSAEGFYGGVFDGQYVYLTPNNNSSAGVVARFNAKAAASSIPQLCASAAALYCDSGSFL